MAVKTTKTNSSAKPPVRAAKPAPVSLLRPPKPAKEPVPESGVAAIIEPAVRDRQAEPAPEILEIESATHSDAGVTVRYQDGSVLVLTDDEFRAMFTP